MNYESFMAVMKSDPSHFYKMNTLAYLGNK